MKIKNVNVYGLVESIVASRLPMDTGKAVDNFEKESFNVGTLTEEGIKELTASKLANSPAGSGHNCFLKGIIVQANIQYKQYWSMQAQRYHWFEIVSSQSKMHRIKQLADKTNDKDLQSACELYDDGKYSIDDAMKYVPMDFELWMRISTNYLQLKTMYAQRRNHKSKEWQYFCDWIETLPCSFLIVGGK